MKKNGLVALSILVLVGLLVAPAIIRAGDSVTLGSTEMRYLGVQQNTPKHGQSRVRYQVTANNSGLDKWKLEIKGFAESQIVSATGNWQWKGGPFTGIQFNDDYSAHQTKIVEVVLEGNFPDTQQLKVGVWTNSSYYSSGPTITGPSPTTATATPTKTATATWTPTTVATGTATATPTSTFTPTPIATSTATVTFTPTPVTTSTATPTATWTPTPVATSTATVTATPTATPTTAPVTVFSCNLGPHKVTITQVSFGLGTSTWRYWVEPGVGLEIEKIVFGIGAIGEANVISASLNWQWVGSGPITGLKLLNGINVPTEVWFKLRNHWDVGPITIGVWSDGQFHSNSRCRGPTAPVGGPG